MLDYLTKSINFLKNCEDSFNRRYTYLVYPSVADYYEGIIKSTAVPSGCPPL
jgi:hypothetical protein